MTPGQARSATAGAATAPRPAPTAVAVSAWCVHLPGVTARIGDHDLSGALPPERASELLGRKGLLAKEPATRLALCAVHRALGLAPGERLAGAPDPGTGVVVGSNLGNVGTVREIITTLREQSWRQVSPMTAPNASSNVIASTIAIRFRLGGPNITVCSGAVAGLDAVAAAALLVRAGRARRVVVVGVEPDDDVAAALQRGRRAPEAGPLRAGAACLVLEPAAEAPRAPVVGRVGAWAGPSSSAPTSSALVAPAGLATDRATALDVAAALGDTYGAAGVLGVAAAVALIESSACHRARVVCGDSVDGWRTVDVTAPGDGIGTGHEPSGGAG